MTHQRASPRWTDSAYSTMLLTTRPSSSNRDLKHKKKESIAFLSRSPQETFLGPLTLASRVAVARYQSMNDPLLACPLFFPPGGREHFHLIIIDGFSTSSASIFRSSAMFFSNAIFFCFFTCCLFSVLLSRPVIPISSISSSSFVIHIFLFQVFMRYNRRNGFGLWAGSLFRCRHACF